MSNNPTNYLASLVNTYSKRGQLTKRQAQTAMDKERGIDDFLSFAMTTRTPLTPAALTDLALWCDWPDGWNPKPVYNGRNSYALANVRPVQPRFLSGLTGSDRLTLHELKPSPPAEVIVLSANGQPYYSPDRYTLIPGTPPYEPTEDKGDMSDYVGAWFADGGILLEPICLLNDNGTDILALRSGEILTAVSFSSLAYLFAAYGHGLCLWHQPATKLDRTAPLVVRTKSGELAGAVMPRLLTSYLATEAVAYRTGGSEEWPH